MKVKITKTRLSIISIAIILISFILSQDWSPQPPTPTSPPAGGFEGASTAPTATELPTPAPTDFRVPVATEPGSPLIPLELQK